MNNLNYYIKSGSFSEENNKIVCAGVINEYLDDKTKEKKTYVEPGVLLFPKTFKEGWLSYDILLNEIENRTSFGFILDYKNVDGKETYYEMQIRNDLYGYSIHFWDGTSWNFKLAGGTKNTIKTNQKYNIKIELRGNVQKLYLNDILLYTYTNMMNVQGLAGIIVRNTTESIIENVKVERKEPSVFSIMKFEKDFDELYNEVLVPQFKTHGYRTVRADECYTSTSILQDIIREINDASIIIADITMDNPNVFYELGYAHALNKPTILLADKDKREKLPFDISGFRTIFYTNSIGGKKEVEHTLRKFIENINR